PFRAQSQRPLRLVRDPPRRHLVAGRPHRGGRPPNCLRPCRGARNIMAEQRLMRIGFTGSGIDRADRHRLDESRIAELASSLSARLLRLAALHPELDETGRLACASLAEIQDEADLIFLALARQPAPVAPPPRVD